MPINFDQLFSALGLSSDAWQPIQEKSKTITNIFKEQVLELSLLCDDQKELAEQGEGYLNACIQAIDQEVANFGFGFSEESLEQLNACRQGFDEVVENDSDLDETKAEDVKALFKDHCNRFFQEKWVKGAAGEFYQLLLLSETEEEVKQAQFWAYRFFEGVGYFAEHQEFFNQISYAHPGNLQVLKNMIGVIDELEGKVLAALEDCLIAAEQSHINAIDRNLGGLAGHNLQIEEGKLLLQECITKGFLLLFQEGQIMGNPRAKQIFLSCFIKDKDLLSGKDRQIEEMCKNLAADVLFALLSRISSVNSL